MPVNRVCRLYTEDKAHYKPVKHLSLLIFIILWPFVIGISLSKTEKVQKNTLPARFEYPEHLAGPYTGGFGEETCRSCHFDYPLNPEGGKLKLSGIPEIYESGKKYEIEVRVERESLGLAGFQLTSRFPEGTQAGTFEYDKVHITTTPETGDSVTYLQHAATGTEPQEKGIKIWTFHWIAPQKASGTVLFHIASNAANGDASEFGDWIYAKEVEILPAEK